MPARQDATTHIHLCCGRLLAWVACSQIVTNTSDEAHQAQQAQMMAVAVAATVVPPAGQASSKGGGSAAADDDGGSRCQCGFSCLVQIETDAKCWRMLAASRGQSQVCHSS
jgi:hypothetical protein